MSGRMWLVGAVALGLTGPAARGGLITLTAGAGGGATADVAFAFAHAGPVAIDRVTGAGTVEAGTAGGRAIFGGSGVPVVLPADGGAYVAGGPAPDDRTGGRGDLSPTAPVSGGDPPAAAARLTLAVSDANVLTAELVDPDGQSLGIGKVDVPVGGWWVLGIGPGEVTDPDPPVDPIVPVDPVGPPEADPGSPPPPAVLTPEPATAALAAAGAALAAGWRGLARRVSRS